MARRPIRGKATRQDTGKSCPFCRFPIKERDEVVSCGECHTAHHDDCWEDHGGCAVPGCAGGPDGGGSTDTRSSGDARGGHVPPKAGPSGKKVTLDPRPRIRARRRKKAKPQPVAAAGAGTTAASSPGSGPSKTQLWIAALAVVFFAIIGIILISNNFGSTDPASAVSCESGTGGDSGVPCYDNGLLPNKPQSAMEREVGSFLTSYFENVGSLNWHSAWIMLSPRQQKQINNGEGYNKWKKDLNGFSRYLKPGNVTVTAVRPSYGDEGVLSVDVHDMKYTKKSDRCGYRGGVTWVRWDPQGQRWQYEPSLDVTDLRSENWGHDQSSRLLRFNC